MELGLVQKIDINEEMQQSYLDYAMSVIVSRALPDARDGLKPVQRRILYAMYDMGLRANSSHKKSARIVGEVLGKYHPHGDSSVYEAMARQAQDFSMRYMLVDGQGNFGSVDGDPPAAMRYTEARLALPALDMLKEIGKDTVDFSPNFDDTLVEPSVLPASIPNLLVNGGTGIAVGMSTSIPPHNLSEVVNALIYMLENWTKLDDISVGQLMEFIQGPDFPTGGIIVQKKDAESLEAAYGGGRGRVQIQARVHVEEMGRNKNRLIVTELPYAVNKSNLISRIANLVRDGKLDGITDLRDESDRQGMRIVIELTKNVEPEDILAKLYKSTPMQSTFSIIMLALVDGEPRTLSLKQALRVYVEHRLEVIRRRTEYDLRKAKERAHILEGYLIAIKNLDEVIALIRRSPDVPTARKRLMKKFKLSEIQAQAILEMQLRRLAALERKKIDQEYKELKKIIKDLMALLKSPKKMRALVTGELLKVKEAYGDRRRTKIISVDGEGGQKALLTSADLLPEKTVWVGVTRVGIISRTRDTKSPRPSGKEAPNWLVKVSTNDTLYLVSEKGKTAAVAVHTLPETEKLSDGTIWHKISPLKPSDKLATIFALPARKSELAEETYVLAVTRGGMVKKSAISELPGPSAQSFTIVRVNDGDVLGWIVLTDGKKDILLATASGMGIRFSEDDVRPMGLVAAGVNGVKLGVGDLVVGAEVLPQKWDNIFIITSDGKGKRIMPKDFPIQGRYGKGVILWKLPDGERLAGLAVGKETQGVTLHLLRAAAKSARLDDAPLRKRATVRGGLVQEVKLGDAIIGLTTIWDLERFVEKIKEKTKKKKNK
ncbi:MAG: DNA gyrase subunit A [Anaerolineae bacterium]|jgi:DNA gyrase subunit A|nr:DNA gyrase subunit A [Anaerolineae bacterium]MBT4458951.1 DNA gyrase subunit A [Anaerolineae bacterium]MBT6060093.1 DNA gyrase subunit A [Anaerolineae bacterium]MBT6322789.1 DNA gyrase subunit A [Anaerolineae bacterium]MBT6811216.1 DNA gyrase subunit A [Anaerolineae bacterium]